MDYLAYAIIFTLAVSIKGGLLGRVFTNWGRFTKQLERDLEESLLFLDKAWTDNSYWRVVINAAHVVKEGVLKWFFDGSIISVSLIAGTMLFSLPINEAMLFTAAYALILVSMGEEAGAVGDYKEGWGDYVELPDNFGRTYGIKKAIQYGAFAGGAMALVTASWCLWIAGALMPLVYFAGNSLYRYVKGGRGWEYSEPLWGAVLGLAYAASDSHLIIW